MSLRTKIVVALLLTVVPLMAADAVLSRVVVRKRFLTLEQDAAIGHLERTRHFLDMEYKRLDSVALGIAAWIPDEDEAPATSPQTLAELDCDLIYLCAPGGGVRWQRCEDPTTRKPIHLKDFPLQAMARTHPLAAEDLVRGLLMTERGTLAVAARPGPGAAGRLVVGRFLTSEVCRSLSKGIGSDIAMLPLDQLSRSLDPLTVERITLGDQPIVRVVDDSTLQVYQAVHDIRGLPIGAVRVSFPRLITALGMQSATDSLVTTLGVAILIMLTLGILIRAVVLNPLLKLKEHATTIGSLDDTSLRIEMDRSDEIGALASGFDDMLEQLAASRKRVADMARQAGISEMAKGTLHNLGNALNTITVSANLAQRHVATSPLEDLHRAVAVLLDDKELFELLQQSARGTHLAPFLTDLAHDLGHKQDAAMRELTNLRQSLEEIVELVAAQERYVSLGDEKEWVLLSQELDLALNLARSSRADTDKVRVEREYTDRKKVYVNRHSVLDVFVSLLVNALDAVEHLAPADRKLALAVEERPDGTVLVRVSDNGEGIEPTDMIRIFGPAYSTRAEDRGLGLHMSANAAAEMGGTLTASSDGPGHGATFTLTLPVGREILGAAPSA